MQIREQGNAVQLIRTPYDKVRKRCYQKVAFSFKQHHSYLSDDGEYLSADRMTLKRPGTASAEDAGLGDAGALTDDEQKKLSAWLRAKADQISAGNRQSAISNLGAELGRSASAIAKDGVSAEQAATIWKAIEQLSKALKRSGNPKSAKAPVAADGLSALSPEDSGKLLSLPPGE